MENRLSKHEIKSLIALHKTLKNKNDADKIKCLILWGKGWSWLQIKEALLISEHYISNVINEYKIGKINKVLKNNHTGNNFKMTKTYQICGFLRIFLIFMRKKCR